MCRSHDKFQAVDVVDVPVHRVASFFRRREMYEAVVQGTRRAANDGHVNSASELREVLAQSVLGDRWRKLSDVDLRWRPGDDGGGGWTWRTCD